MTSSKNALFAVFITAAVLLGGVAVVSAAPGSIDSGATDTSNITYVSNGETVSTQFNGSMGAEEKFGLPILNSTTSDLAMNVSYNNVTYYEFTGTWDSYASGQATTSDDYIHNFTESDLSRIPVDPNENVSIEITYWNESASSPTPTTITVYLEATGERNVQRVTSSAAFADVETKSEPLYRGNDDYSAVQVDDTAVINGSNTTVIYTLEDSNSSTPFENSTTDLSEAGAFTLMKANVDGDETVKIPVFLNGVPDWFNTSSSSYAVYDKSSDKVEVHLSEDNFGTRDRADIMVSSDVYRAGSIGTVWDLAGGRSGAGIDAITRMVM